MRGVDLEVLREVFTVIEDRRDRPRPDSYVSGLMSGGLRAVIEKVDEESLELREAARGRGDLVHETADLIFHVMVLLAFKRVPLAAVLDELRRRRK
ncbi:MAG: phosphoribosyl-ATP diphosphatase [Candidatus Bathyarchaeia archaeon]